MGVQGPAHVAANGSAGARLRGDRGRCLPTSVEAVFSAKPALHRFPGSMAQAHARAVHDDRRGVRRRRPSASGRTPATGDELLARLPRAAWLRRGEVEDLPRVPRQATAACAPDGWEQAPKPFSDRRSPLGRRHRLARERCAKVRELEEARRRPRTRARPTSYCTTGASTTGSSTRMMPRIPLALGVPATLHRELVGPGFVEVHAAPLGLLLRFAAATCPTSCTTKSWSDVRRAERDGHVLGHTDRDPLRCERERRRLHVHDPPPGTVGVVALWSWPAPDCRARGPHRHRDRGCARARCLPGHHPRRCPRGERRLGPTSNVGSAAEQDGDERTPEHAAMVRGP